MAPPLAVLCTGDCVGIVEDTATQNFGRLVFKRGLAKLDRLPELEGIALRRTCQTAISDMVVFFGEARSGSSSIMDL